MDSVVKFSKTVVYVFNVLVLFSFGADFLHLEVNLIIISNYLDVRPHLKKDNDVE